MSSIDIALEQLTIEVQHTPIYAVIKVSIKFAKNENIHGIGINITAIHNNERYAIVLGGAGDVAALLAGRMTIAPIIYRFNYAISSRRHCTFVLYCAVCGHIATTLANNSASLIFSPRKYNTISFFVL